MADKNLKVLSNEQMRKIALTTALVLPLSVMAPYANDYAQAGSGGAVLQPGEQQGTKPNLNGGTVTPPPVVAPPVITPPVVTPPTTGTGTAPTMRLMKSGINPMAVSIDRTDYQSSELSTNKSITETFTIPDMERFIDVTSNTGTVVMDSVNGTDVTVTMDGGDYFKRIQVGGSVLPAETKEVIAQDKADYDDGDFAGTLSQYVFSGQYIPEDIKYAEVAAATVITGSVPGVEDASLAEMNAELAKIRSGFYTVPYTDGTHSGTLASTKETVVQTWVEDVAGVSHEFYEIYYVLGGNVTKPSEDTRTYKFKGTVTKPEQDLRVWEYYYKYDLTFNYEVNSSPDVTLPASAQIASSILPYNTFNLTGSASDKDGDDLFLVYSIQGVAGHQDVKTPIGKGASFDEMFTLPTNLAEGTYTVDVHTEDAKGNISGNATMDFFVDNTAPTLALVGADTTSTFYGSVAPNITPTDNTSSGGEIKLVSTLDGKPYVLGTPITTSGTHTLVVEATDKVGNTVTETYAIKVNETPQVVKNFDPLTVGKFKTTDYVLSDYFTDADGDTLTVTVVSADTDVASVVTTPTGFSVTSDKQGKSQIRVKVSDGNTESAELMFEVEVGNANPLITITDKDWILVDDTSDLELNGTIMDSDKDTVDVTAVFNTVSKTTNLTATGLDDAFQLVWGNADVPSGVTSGGIVVNSIDVFGGVDSKIFDKIIVKVTGDKSSYLPIVAQYEGDTSSASNDWTDTVHNTLLDAYEGMIEYKAVGTIASLFDTITKVKALNDGSLKTQYLATLHADLLVLVNADLDGVTVPVLDMLGITGIEATNLQGYIDMLKEYQLENNPLTIADIQVVVDVVNAVEGAVANKTTATIGKAHQEVINLTDGKVKADTVNKILAIALQYVIDNASTVGIDDVSHAGLSSNPLNIADYNTYLAEVVTAVGAGAVVKSDLQDAINLVDSVKTLYSTAVASPTQANVIAFETAVTNLTVGSFKTSMEPLIVDVALLYFVASPTNQDATDYGRLGVTLGTGSIADYNSNGAMYIADIGATGFTTANITEVITATDLFNTGKSQTGSALSTTISTLKAGLTDGTLETELVKGLNTSLLDGIKADPGNATADDLINGGFTDVDPANEKEYQDGLVEYKDDLGGTLTDKDIQDVINAVNAVVKAEKTKLKADIDNAYIVVGVLKDGKFKTGLIDRLDALLLENLTGGNGVTIEDLENLDLKDINKDLEDLYGELIDGYGQPLTKDDIQLLIDVANLVSKAMKDLLLTDLSNLSTEISKMRSSVAQLSMLDVHSALEDINDAELSMTVADVTTAKATVNGVTSSVKAYLTKMVTAGESVQIALFDGTKEAKAQTDVSSLDVGKFQDRLQDLVGVNMHLEIILTKPSTSTLVNWQNAGLTDVKDSEVPKYTTTVDAVLTELGSITKSEVQLIVEGLNGLSGITPNTSSKDIKDIITIVDKWVDSTVKDTIKTELTDKYNDKVKDEVYFNPNKPNPFDGFTGVDQGNIQDYLDAIKEIEDEKGPLTKDEAQQVIESVNKTKPAIDKPTPSNVNDALKELEDVVDSKYKDRIEKELTDIKNSFNTGGGGGGSSEVVTPQPNYTDADLPSDKDSTMSATDGKTKVVLEVVNKEMSTDESLKLRVKVDSKADLKKTKLLIVAKSNKGSEPIASLVPMAVSEEGYEEILEIDLSELVSGTYKQDKEARLKDVGSYSIKGVLVYEESSSLETNAVKVEVYSELTIPNTNLPNNHGLPVATMKLKEDTKYYEKDAKGNFVVGGTLKAGTLHPVFDTHKGRYVLSDGRFVETSTNLTVHIGKGEIRLDSVQTQDKNGKALRTLKRGQEYKVYSYDGKRYNIGGGEYVPVLDGVTYVFGWFVVDVPMDLLDKDNKVVRKLNKGEKYRIYSTDKDSLRLGGGLHIKNDISKMTFIKN